MKNRFTLGTRLSLALSLAIASSLVANVVKAESHSTSRATVDALSQNIAKLIDLDPDRQNLVKLAIDRAIASKENGADKSEIAGGKTNTRPALQDRITNPQPIKTPNIQKDNVPTPIINGRIANPQPDRSPILVGKIKIGK
jgi:hypothetical protein